MPRRALTAASVERIKPPASGQVEHFDKGFPGLALRVSYGGARSFVFFYRTGGRLRRMTLGQHPAMSLAQARDAWRQARVDVAKGIDPAQARQRETPAMGFAAVAEEWLKRDQAKNRTAADVRRTIERHVLPAWGHKRIDEIGRRDVLDLMDSIADRGWVIMARRVHAHVHRLFCWAIGRGIVDANPAAGVPKPGADNQRDRVLSDAELATVLRGTEALGWPFGPALRLLILTGARLSEIGRLRWSEIHSKCGEIVLKGERTKNGQPHTIPLSAPAKALLDGLPRVSTSAFVFTTTGTTSISGWSRAKSQLNTLAPIEPWRIHDLRRTVATGLQRLGIGLQVIEAVLGHVSGSRRGIVGVYQRHDFADEKRKALEAWAAFVLSTTEGRPLAKV